MTADDDRRNLFDLHDAIQTLEEAQAALRKAMDGLDDARDLFVFKLGFARGRLLKILARVNGEGDEA